MAQKYGNVFSLMLGNRLVVVLNGLHAIEETIIKHPKAFAGRPSLHTFSLANSKAGSLSLSDYTPRWRLARRIAVSAIHNFVKDSDALGHKLSQESQRLIRYFKQQKGRPVNTLAALKSATGNIILNALFGINWSYDDEGLRRIIDLADSFRQAIHGCSHVDFLPMVKYLPNKALSDLKTVMKIVSDILSQLFVQNKETYDGVNVRNIADSFMSVVEKETEREKENHPEGLTIAPLLSDEQIIPAVADLFGAGFETSSALLYWSLAYLIKYPDIQQQLHDELDQVIGQERLPTLGDIPSLPLLQATVFELLRVTSMVPLAVPRSTTSETKIQDFTVPKDTIVFVNLWSVHRDPALWKDPEVFDPRRFLDRAGQVVDPKFLRGFLPFSGGRRKCPGEVLAIKQVSFLLAALLHSFRFSQDGLPNEYQGINLVGQFGLTLIPETFYVKIDERC
ncbi:Cytochrome P450 1A1 [Porites harrisoni]